MSTLNLGFSMWPIDRFKSLFINYDPYGLLWASALQVLCLASSLYMINFFFDIPYLEVASIIPLFGFFAIAQEASYNRRIQSMVIFCSLCIVYAAILSTVQNYRALMVFTVGLITFSLFFFSRNRYPKVLLMVSPLLVTAYSGLLTDLDGDFYQIITHVFGYFFVVVLAIAIMLLFPRLYFFKVWVRSFSYTLRELSARLQIVYDDAVYPYQLMQHLVKMQEFTNGLSSQDYGFSARRISIRLLNLYTFVVALVNKVDAIGRDELYEIITACNNLARAIDAELCLDVANFKKTSHSGLSRAHKDIVALTCTWNELCLKI